MTRSCVIVIPCVQIDAQVLETLTYCLQLEQADAQIALLPDQPVVLPAAFHRENVTVIPTGDCTIARKRNLAIRHFRHADYFAFIDSDAYPETGWLRNGLDFLERNPDTWAVGGPNLPPDSDPFLQRVVGNASRSFLLSGPLYFTKSRSSSRKCRRLHSCNLIVPRRAFDTLGGFDESLFTGEDHELCDRIYAAGKDIWFRTDVAVYHHTRSLWAPLFRQRLTYGYCSAAISRTTMSGANLFLHLPLLWLLVFCGLALTEAVVSEDMQLTVLVLLACLAAATIEAVRTSGSLREMLYTLAAILLGYLAVTGGQILAMLRYPLELKQVYAQRTQREEHVP